jgi:hypothetical protein
VAVPLSWVQDSGAAVMVMRPKDTAAQCNPGWLREPVVSRRIHTDLSHHRFHCFYVRNLVAVESATPNHPAGKSIQYGRIDATQHNFQQAAWQRCFSDDMSETAASIRRAWLGWQEHAGIEH